MWGGTRGFVSDADGGEKGVVGLSTVQRIGGDLWR